MAETNVVIPAGYDLAWSLAVLIVIALAVVALISLARSARRLTAGQALVWVLIVLALPVFGALAWLAIGRRDASQVRPKQS